MKTTTFFMVFLVALTAANATELFYENQAESDTIGGIFNDENGSPAKAFPLNPSLNGGGAMLPNVTYRIRDRIIASGNDEDFYKLTLPSSGRLNITLEQVGTPETSTSLAWTVRLFSERRLSDPWQEHALARSSKRLSFYEGLPSSDAEGEITYYIEVDSYSLINHSPELYDIVVEFTPINTESTPNGQAEDATTIPVNGVSFSSQLSDSNDIDYYGFSLSQDSQIQVTLSKDTVGTSSSYETFQVWLFNESTGESDYLDSMSVVQNERSDSFTIGLPANNSSGGAETYFLRVKTNHSGTYSPEQYQIAVLATPGSHFETEFNDSKGSADPILADGSAYFGHLENSSDNDYYGFSLSQDSQIQVTLSKDTVGTSSSYETFQVWLFNESTGESNYLDSMSVAQNERSDSFTIGLPANNSSGGAETYFLRVKTNHSGTYSPEQYQIAVLATPGSHFETEFNDSKGSADPILADGSAYFGHLENSSDNDYYGFSLSQDSQIQVTLSKDTVGTSSSYETFQVWLFNESTGESNYLDSMSVAQNERSDSFTIGLPANNSSGGAETYFLRVITNHSGTYSPEQYQIAVLATPGSHFETEFNNSKGSADPILADGSAYFGHLENSSDNDYYGFSLSQDSQIQVTLSKDTVGTSSSYETFQVWLFNESTGESNYLDSMSVAQNERSDSFTIGLPANNSSGGAETYFLRVKTNHSGTYSPEQYQISVATSSSKVYQRIVNLQTNYVIPLNGGLAQLYGSATSGLPVTYSPSDPTIATIDSSGRIIPHAEGTTSVFVYQGGNSIFAPASNFLFYISITGSPLELDSDNDGLPNYWEEQNGLNPNVADMQSQDSDNDGDTDIEEFVNATDPNDTNSKFDHQIQFFERLANGKWILVGNARNGLDYRVEFSETLVGEWSSFTPIKEAAGNLIYFVIDNTNTPNGFFRVSVQSAQGVQVTQPVEYSQN